MPYEEELPVPDSSKSFSPDLEEEDSEDEGMNENFSVKLHTSS